MADIVSPYPMGGAPPPVQPFTSTTRGFQGPHFDEKKKTPEILEAERKQDEAAQLKLDAASKQAEADAKQEQIEASAAQARETSARLAEAQKQEQQVHFERAQEAAAAKAAGTQADLEKASKITTLWEDKSTPAKIFSAIMLGSAEGANRQGGDSAAMKIYNQQAAEDRQSKLDHLENAKQAHIRATGDIAGAEAMHKSALDRIDNERIARDNILAKEIETMGKKIPRAAAKAAETAANIRGEAAKAQLEQQDRFARDYHSAQATRSTTTVTGEKTPGGGGSRQPVMELQKIGAAAADVENTREAKKIPEAARASYAEKLAAWNRDEATKESGAVARTVRGGAQFLGMKPTSFEATLTPDEANIHRVITGLNNMEATIKASGNATTESDNKAGASKVASQIRDPGVWKKYLDTAEKQAMQRAQAITPPAPGPAPVAAPAPTQGQPSKSAKMSDEDSEAFNWARANPKNPDAIRILKSIGARRK